DESFEDLFCRKSNFSGNRFCSKILRIDSILAKFVVDAHLIKQAGNIGLGRHGKMVAVSGTSPWSFGEQSSSADLRLFGQRNRSEIVAWKISPIVLNRECNAISLQ